MGVRSKIKISRDIGRVVGEGPGPLFLVVAGLHGNEPSGISAAERVCQRLKELRASFSGEIRAVAGNLSALSQGVRCLARDLNRSWTSEETTALREKAEAERSAEDVEQLALLNVLESALLEKDRRVVLLDLHSTSAHGAPFLFAEDSGAGRILADAVPVPKVFAFEKYIRDTFIDYARPLGIMSFGFEAGQHDAPESVDHHESFLWLALEALGALKENALQERERHVAALHRACVGLPRAIRVMHRHPVKKGDGFKMKPGLRHFQNVGKGDILAEDNNGEVRAPQDAVLLMPLYQSCGEDGFFLGEIAA